MTKRQRREAKSHNSRKTNEVVLNSDEQMLSDDRVKIPDDTSNPFVQSQGNSWLEDLKIQSIKQKEEE